MPHSYLVNIRCLYLIKLAKWLMLTMPILYLFYQENGLGTQDLFWLKAIYSIAIFAFEVPSGYLGDLWGRRASLILGSTLGFVGFALYSFSHGFWSFALCEIILGIGQSFISGSDSALLYDTLQAEKREAQYTQVEGRMVSVGNFAEALAAPAGVALAALSLRTPFYLQTIIAFAAIPASFMLYEPFMEKACGKCRVGKSYIWAIIRYSLFIHSGLRAAIFYSALMGTATLTMAWFVQPFFVHINLPLAWYALLIPLLNVVTGMVSLHAWRLNEWWGKRVSLLFIALGIGGNYLLMGLADGLVGIFFLLLFYGFRGVATPILRNAINEFTPSDIRATVLSIRSLIIRLAFALLGPLLGWQADIMSLPWALAGAGVFFLLMGCYAALLLSRAQEREGSDFPQFLSEK